MPDIEVWEFIKNTKVNPVPKPDIEKITKERLGIRTQETRLQHISQEELDAILIRHKDWLDGKGGEQAVLTGYNLDNMDLSGRALDKAVFDSCSLHGADLSRSSVTGTEIIDCHADNIKMIGVKSVPDTGKQEQGLLIMNSSVQGMDISGSELEGASFRNIDAREIKADRVKADNVSLEEVELSGGSFEYMKADGLHMEECLMLSKAGLPSTSVTGASFTSSSFHNVAGMNYNGATFTECGGNSLDQTLVKKAISQEDLDTILDSHEQWLKSKKENGRPAYGTKQADLSSYNMDELSFKGRDLTNAIFTNSSLQGANFNGCTIDGCDFSMSNLDKADFTKAGGYRTNLDMTTCRGAVFDEANFRYCSICGSDLTDSTWNNRRRFPNEVEATLGTERKKPPLKRMSQEELDQKLDSMAANEKAGGKGKGNNKIDLSHCDLRGLTFKDRELSGINMAGADIRGCKFENVQLKNVNLFGAKGDEETRFSGCTMTNVNLNQASMPHVVFSHTNMRNCMMNKASFRSSCLEDVSLSNCHGYGVDFSNSHISGESVKEREVKRQSNSWTSQVYDFSCSMDRCSFSHADFSGSVMSQVKVSRSDLSMVDFEGTDFYSSSIDKCDVSYANMADTRQFDLEGSVYQGKDLIYQQKATKERDGLGKGRETINKEPVKIREVKGSGTEKPMKQDEFNKILDNHKKYLEDPVKYASLKADLSGKNLTGINMEGADLKGADLSGACLDGINARGADFTRANLSGTSLSNTCLDKACFCEASLIRADLSYADLSGADFSKAGIIESKAHSARFDSCICSGTYFAGNDMSDSSAIGLETENSVFRDCNISGSDWTSSRILENSQLYKVDFSNAKFDNSVVKASITEGCIDGVSAKEADWKDSTILDTSHEDFIYSEKLSLSYEDKGTELVLSGAENEEDWETYWGPVDDITDLDLMEIEKDRSFDHIDETYLIETNVNEDR